MRPDRIPPILALLAVLASTPVAAQDDPATDPLWSCREPFTQQEMNWCAQQDYLDADRLLNEQWVKTAAAMHQRDRQARSQLGQPDKDFAGFFATLLQAQRTWLTFRDTHCASEGSLYRGGSIEPLIVAMCKTDLTRQRITQLHYLESPE